MPKLTDLLNQITGWIQHNLKLDSGLSREQIEAYLEGKSFTFSEEIIELYQWRNGTGYGSFFASAEAGYDEQIFYSLGAALRIGEEWSEDYCPDTRILALFALEGTYYWTVLPDKSEEFAPIYVTDEPDFDTSSHSYPSLAAMLEKMISRLKFIWKID
jgi:hypothetical protein